MQRACARIALRESARKCGAPEDGWVKNADDVPQPQGGLHWSIAHKRHWAVAVIADQPVGIDIECIEPRRDDAFDALAGSDEWGIIGERSWLAFFRLWTAKEAVLKANGAGIAEFDACLLVKADDSHHLTLNYQSQEWSVEHYYHAGHVAAVTCSGETVNWLVVEDIADEGIAATADDD
ncbi:MAG: 4'-phosphopantetheinyl transferase superfamily protein [Planctomycetes bacterium]|nr:4'-phosphopantetheinyl transferase superfamily protein [Planctomycetota bacterium]